MPFAGVDPMAVTAIQQIVRRLATSGMGVLVSDHSVRETLQVCDRVYVMNLGKVVESGTPEEIASSDVARKMYLGEDFRL
jgi:lipopolysaccharide export system ATP-binding protein